MNSLILVAALASPKAAPAPIETVPVGQEDFEVSVPRSEIDLSSNSGPRPAVGRFALRASTWMPDNLSVGSLVADTTVFKSSGLPGIYGTLRFEPGWSLGAVKIAPLAGIGYRGLRRSGTLITNAYSEAVTADASLFSTSLGFEIWSPRVSLSWLRPYVTLGAQLHSLVTPSSALDLGAVRWGYSGQGTLGMEISPWGANAVAFDLSAVSDWGRLDGERLRAWGLQGGIRWSF